ncbi:MAG: hypothetical protein JRI23_04995, partial [Deltaproteobacteria bacterium]|nr:hypothetical protein [Deltaproteobacteria bacterium]MBW2530907.1 hypothetical protein [Deltaproteobacteria bacterium]
SNYGSFFNFTDRLFGTRYLPEDQGSFDPLGRTGHQAADEPPCPSGGGASNEGVHGKPS